MEQLRTAPGAEIVLAAVAGEDRVYVVGGAVRDALLGRVPKEIDLVVEGDAIAVATRAAARIEGALTVHERFGTATVAKDGFAFDIVSARTETYERPGALPTVTLGATIEQDLARRDFTVNAIAADLGTSELVAWPGAREDLKRGVLRVLHDRSFSDDPTRMLRLVRYMARLGFEPADEVDPDLLDTVTPDRIGHEVLRMLGEPPRVWHDLEYGGLAQKLFGPDYEPNATLAASLAHVSDARARLDALKFPAKEREVILAAARLHDQLDVSDADLWRRLCRERPESIRMAADGGERGAQRFLERDWKLEITGADLVQAGLSGAQVGDGLEKAMVAMINGEAPDRAAQLRAAGVF
jgi:tRNA nucleotidyltransferase (CCA-adding enzyme)